MVAPHLLKPFVEPKEAITTVLLPLLLPCYSPEYRLYYCISFNMAESARDSAQKARSASRKLQALATEERVAMLNRVADALLANEAEIMAENAKVRSIEFLYRSL
jgi:hypothetical protein